jgi:hypothetical protein
LQEDWIARYQVDLGVLLAESQGNCAAAEPFFREGLAGYERALPPADDRTTYAKALLGTCLVRLERYDEAEPLLLDRYATVRQSYAADHQYTQSALRDLIALYERWGRTDEADRYRVQLTQ